MRKTETLLGKYCDPVTHTEFLVVEVTKTTSEKEEASGQRRFTTRSSYQTFDGQPLQLVSGLNKDKFMMHTTNRVLERIPSNY